MLLIEKCKFCNNVTESNISIHLILLKIRNIENFKITSDSY